MPTARWNNLNSQYAYRDDNLRAMGFKSYRSYLASELWKSIRARVFERAFGRCERGRCKREATQVHHRAYDPATLRGDCIDALTASCARCHKKAELGQKASPVLGQERYQRLMGANEAMLKGAGGRARRQRRSQARTAARLVRPS